MRSPIPRPGRNVERSIRAGVPAAAQFIVGEIEGRKDLPIIAMSPAAAAMSPAAAASPPAAAMSVMSCSRDTMGSRGWLQPELNTR